MAIKINLLPSGQRIGKETLKILRVTRILGVVFLGIFIVFGLGLAVFFTFSSVQLNSLNSANKTLKGQVSSLKSSETQLTLLKDRIGKIKKVQNVPTAVKNLESINSLIAGFSSDSNVSELEISPTKITTSINFKSNGDIVNFLKALESSNSFQAIALSSFSFNPATGYLVSVAITGKQ